MMLEAKASKIPAEDTTAQRAVLVLGMHRSGTSAFTRTLSLLGLDLPTHLVAPYASQNRQGFWESTEVMQLNDDILASCDSWWGDWGSIPAKWFSSNECRSFSDRLMDVLRRDFANSGMFVIKDPRICRLVPLWLQTFARLDIEPLVVIPVRHPTEVAASLAARDGFDPLISNLLWGRHLLDAERYTRGMARSVVTFDDLMKNWRSTIDKIGADLRIEWPVTPVSAAVAIEEFLTTGDRHHWARDNCALPDWMTAAYKAVLSEDVKNSERWDPRDWDSLRRQFDRTTKIFFGTRNAPEGHEAERSKRIIEAEGRIENLNAQVDWRAKRLGEAESRIEYLNAQIAERAERLSEVESHIENLNAQIAERAERLSEAESHIENLNAQVAERAERLGEAEGRIKALNAQVLERAERLGEAEGRIRELALEVGALRNSTSWRMTAPIRLIVEKLRSIYR